MVLLLVVISPLLKTSVKAEEKYGVSYDTDQYEVEWKSKNYVKVYNEDGNLLGVSTGVFGNLRYKKKIDSKYCETLVVKMTMDPKSTKAKNGGYAFSEYCSVKCTLPNGSELEYYEPQNVPSDTITLPVGFQDKASIGISYDDVSDDLDITSKCDTVDRLCYTIFDYKPSTKNPFADNKYVANESSQYAFYDYSTKNTPTLTIKLNARFGVARDCDRSPWSIYLNDVSSATKTFKYQFK